MRRREQSLVLVAAGLVIAVVVLAPFGSLALELLSTAGAARRAAGMLRSPVALGLIARSLGIAGAVTTLALLARVPLALLLGRTDAAGRRPALLLHAFPMFLPPFLLALGWFQLFGRQGFLGSKTTSEALFSELGAVLILALAFTPVVTSLVSLGLGGIDPALEEAARAVAPPRRVATRILLPIARPAAALAALVVFTLSLSELGVPMFLRVHVYPEAVFVRLGGMQFVPGEAFALVLPLLLLALALLALERRFVSRKPLAALGLRTRERPALPLRRWRGLATAAAWLAAVLSAVPILALVLRAMLDGGFAAASSWIGGSLQTSLLTASLAAAIIALLGVVTGWALARRVPGAGLLDAVTVLAFVTPAAVLGVGLIAMWNRPATQAVYTSVAILVLGYVARYTVIGTRTVAAAVAQSSPHLEEAAAAFGAGFLQRLARVILPVHGRGVLGAWLLALVFCLRDLDTAVLFYPPGREPLPVRIFTLEANGPQEVVAALAVIHTLLTAGALCAGAFLLGRRTA